MLHLFVVIIIAHVLFTHMDTLFNLDIDECSDRTDGCSQIYTNTSGSFICVCNSGLQMDNNGVTCNGMQKK